MAQRSSRAEERKRLGGRLRDTARAAGLTSDAIAEALGVQGGSVRGWWVGRNEPSVERLKQYAALVKVSPSYLLYGSEQPMGPAGTLQEWRLRAAELIRDGLSPEAALERISAGPAEDDHGIPDDQLTEEERALLNTPAQGMWRVLREVSAGDWDRLEDSEKELVLRMIEAMAKKQRGF